MPPLGYDALLTLAPVLFASMADSSLAFSANAQYNKELKRILQKAFSDVTVLCSLHSVKIDPNLQQHLQCVFSLGKESITLMQAAETHLDRLIQGALRVVSQ